MRWIAVVSFALVILLAILSFLPLIETNVWWIRYWDFPRVQIIFALVVLLAIHVIASERDGERIVAVVLALAALVYHGVKLVPFTPVAPQMAVAVNQCPEGAGLRILSFNAQRSNEAAATFVELVEAVDPDLILVMETDAFWDETLSDLQDEYPEVVRRIPEQADYYGMHLLSRLPLRSPEVLFAFGDETPSIVTGVELRSGDVVEFRGVHPRPPLWLEQGTVLRDAELYRAALEAAESERPTIVAGDFNAVPWEDATRRAMQVGGLLAPRIGREWIPTYGAQSLWKSWPLDYVLYQDALALLGFARLPHAGSDHYPVLAHLCLAPGMAERQDVPAPHPDDLMVIEQVFEDARHRIE